MQADEEGFYYPVTDTEKCIECGLCESTCPVRYSDGIVRTDGFKNNAYACKAVDKSLVAASSSGGMFSVFAEKTFAEGGVVYGVAMSEDNRSAVYVRAESSEELSKLRGSKYIHAQVGDAFDLASKDIAEGRKVLFSGTPCVIAGLKAAFGEDYKAANLLTVSVICHGAPSESFWSKYLVECAKGLDAAEVNFRDKRYGWKLYSVSVKNAGGAVVSRKTKTKDEYIRLFLKNVALRPSCYECTAKGEDAADIILGDAWGVSAFAPNMYDDRGVSVALTLSDRGRAAFDAIRDRIVYESVDSDEVIRYNGSIVKSTAKPEARDRFYGELKTTSVKALADKYAPLGVKEKLMDCYRRIKKVGIYALFLVMMLTLTGCKGKKDTTAHEHEVTKKDWVDGTPATCTTKGTMGHYVCPICGLNLDLSKKVISDITIDEIDHTLEEWVDPTASTCKEAGIPGYYRCKVCWQVFDKDMQRINMEALTLSTITHLYGDLRPLQEPTCTEDGMLPHYHCSVCDSYFNEEYVEVSEESLIIPAGHKGELIKIVTEPVEGIYCPAVYLCSRCGEEITQTLDFVNVGMPVLLLDKYVDGVSELPELPAVTVPETVSDATGADASGAASGSDASGDGTGASEGADADDAEPVPIETAKSADTEEETAYEEPKLVRDGETDAMLYTAKYIDGETGFYKMAMVSGMSDKAGEKSEMQFRLMEADGRDYKFDLGDRRPIKIEGYDIERDYSASVYELKDGGNDLTAVRANFAGRIFSETVHSRDKGDQLQETVTGGAFTGTPVLVFINGVYSGVYSMGIPEDQLLFEPDPTMWPEVIAYARKNTDQTEIKTEIGKLSDSGFRLDYVSEMNGGTTDEEYAVKRLNRMIKYVHEHNNEEFSEKIDNYADVDRTIDSMLFSCLVGAENSVQRNIRWITYDNKHWIPIVDGLETSFGLNSKGEAVNNFDSDPKDYRGNFLYRRTFKMNYDEYCTRYKQLRASVWSDETLFTLLNKCFAEVPFIVGESEYERKYGEVPSEETSEGESSDAQEAENTANQTVGEEFAESAGRINGDQKKKQIETRYEQEVKRITDWLTKRLYYLDNYFGYRNGR